MDPLTRPDDLTPLPSAPTSITLGSEPLTPLVVPPRPKGWPLLAWVIILAVVSFIAYRTAAKPAGTGAGKDGTAWQVTVEAQGRYLVGAADLLTELNRMAGPAAGAANPKQDLFNAAKTLDAGSYSQRLRYAVVAGELSGPKAARDALGELEDLRKADKLEAREQSAEAAGLLDRLYRGYERGDGVVLGEPDQEKLRDGLRWFGELALAPEGGDPEARKAVMVPARRTAVTYFVMAGVILFGLVVGGIVLLSLLVSLYLGKLRLAIETGSGHGGVYAETFALYMLLFFGMAFGASFIDVSPYNLLVMLAAMFLSLLALAWPVLRGIPWHQVREDIGLNFGGKPIVNVLLGPVTYFCAFPVLAVAVAIMFGLARLTGINILQPGEGPSHPIIGIALQKSWLVWLQVFLLAAVGAPIVEEIMFRGVLYRHLREATRWFRVGTSVILSVLVSSFIFAIIHPQGLLGVPVLMALAGVFALFREWRGSLVPPILAHGINNGLLVLMMLMSMG